MFDGIHLGHQNLIWETIRYAKKHNILSVLITFEQHPKEILQQQAPPSIIPLAKRLEIIEKMGLDVCILIRFTKDFANLSAHNFIRQHLVKQLGMKYLIVGENFRFGHKGSGDCQILKQYAVQHGYCLTIMDIVKLDNLKISSTNIRQAIAKNKFEVASKMLGRPFALIGKVVPGKQRGRKLGFPTANLKLLHTLQPSEGVYYGYSIVENLQYPALISIGNCPTFHEREKLKIEVYLEGFSGHLYDTLLETSIWGKIRDQKAYANQEELCQQLQQDKKFLLRHFEKHSI